MRLELARYSLELIAEMYNSEVITLEEMITSDLTTKQIEQVIELHIQYCLTPDRRTA